MVQDVAKEIAALRKMTVKELRARHVELFGEENRSSNRQYLFRRIAWRVQAMAEGGLSERAKQRAKELAREADLRSRPPADFSVEPAPAALRTVSGDIKVARDDRLPMPGTVITRVYKGHEYRVTVLPNGFEYDGETYRSLSAVAHVISGSHWNGFRFFGLLKDQMEVDRYLNSKEAVKKKGRLGIRITKAIPPGTTE